jgi:hypothetical protein
MWFGVKAIDENLIKLIDESFKKTIVVQMINIEMGNFVLRWNYEKI